MKIKNLIGKKIADIKLERTNYEYTGSIPLEESNGLIFLESGEAIRIPYKFGVKIDAEVEIVESISEKQRSIFNLETKKTFLNKILSIFPKGEHSKSIEKNKSNIQNRKITAIYYQQDKCFPELDKCVIELDSNYLISEIVISIIGTGRTGIWIFTSKQDLYNKFGNHFLKLDD